MACPMRVASAPCILVTVILIRSKANTLTVSTDTEGLLTHLGFLRLRGSPSNLLEACCGLQWLGLLGILDWTRPRLHQFPLRRCTWESRLQGRKNSGEKLERKGRARGAEGLPNALHLTGNLASPGTVGLQPHLTSCWKGRAH